MTGITTMLRAATLATSLIFALPATAQVTGSLPGPTPTLRHSATVTSDVVRIGDLVYNAGARANIPIFRSPDIGTTGSVPVSQVLQALRSHELADVATDGVNAIEVTRSGRAISVKEIESRILRAFGAQFRSSDAKNLSVFFDRDLQPIYVEATATADLQLNNGYFDPRSGRFDVTMELPGSALARQSNLRFTGSLIEMVEAAVLTRTLARGELVKASDFTIARRPKSELKGEAPAAADQIVGREARAALTAGQPLRQNDLGKPERIKRDESITLVYEVPGILLTCRGKALESGSDGDLINVLNVQSKRSVQGIVTGPGRVSVAMATAQVADNVTTTAASQ
jgi:flagella basal body P-ring formation protein FlgA